MKKILLIVICLFSVSLSAFAANNEEITKVFNKYVSDANSYSSSLINYYLKTAKIYRVVNKKQGGQQTVTIPYDRFIKELNRNAFLAKTVGYKNKYSDIKYSKLNATTYKISATRTPRNDKKGLPCYFIFTKIDNNWKIKEESMTTNVQAFLNAN